MKQKSTKEKAAETRKKKLDLALKEMGETPRKKPRKKRKPMTAEQKEAAIERLAKARKIKQKNNPEAKNASIHPNVAKLPDDDELSAVNIKNWIKHNEDLLKGMRGFKNSDDRSERKEWTRRTVYVQNLKTYLRTSVYLDSHWGDEMQNKIIYKCYAKAYDKNGQVKRSVGTWYDDVGLWTKEMERGEFYE